ncbi:MAG: hypothetical protein ABIH11_07585 [Candidatus Altiarchaeota archaeon]
MDSLHKLLGLVFSFIFLSTVAFSQQPDCYSIKTASSQADCNLGACSAGTCVFKPYLTHAGGYCDCVTTSTSTTLSRYYCDYDRKLSSCVGVCPKGESCIDYGGGKCSCGTTTTQPPYYCYYDTLYGKCEGRCPKGQSCVEVSRYQCSCGTATPSTTMTTMFRPVISTTTTLFIPIISTTTLHVPIISTTTTTVKKYPKASDLIDELTPTTQPTIVLSTQPPQVLPWQFLDDDHDSVLNGWDNCPGTPEGTPVDKEGCGCTENDGGMMPYVFGSTKEVLPDKPKAHPNDQGITVDTSMLNIQGIYYADTCVNDITLKEQYCNESQRRREKIIECEGGCAHGKCLCNDGDGGLVYDEAGVFQVNVPVEADTPDDFTIPEYAVLDNGKMVDMKNTKYLDELRNRLVLTTTTLLSQIEPIDIPVMNIPLFMSDYCVSDTVLREFYCDENGSITSLNHVCKDTCEDGKCIVVPNLRYLFVPVRWAGTQQQFDDAVDEQLDFFINAIPLKDCPEEVEVEKVDLADGLGAGDFDCYTSSVRDHVDGLGIDRSEYDAVIGLTDQNLCGGVVGRSNGADTIWSFTGYASVTAHELGHIYGLEDEYCSNVAGATDGRCNDGDSQNDGAATGDLNYLKSGGVEDCPPDGSNDSTNNECCNFFDDEWWHAVRSCTGMGYGICCLGNKNSQGGRAIMSFADVDVLSPGPRAFDETSKAHLATVPVLKCGNPNSLVFSFIFQYVNLLPVGDEASMLMGGMPGDAEEGYAGNISFDKVVVVELDVGEDGKVSERKVILQDGRPTMIPSGDGDYHLMVFDAQENELWSAMFDLHYKYFGARLGGADYSNISYDTRPVSYRIPYLPEMAGVKLFKKGELIYARGLDFCVEDGVCGVAETVETCPKDCRPDSRDKVCVNAGDGVCDPDCKAGVDPDCGKAPVKKTVEDKGSKSTCMPALPAILALSLSLMVSAPYLIKGRKSV